LTVAGSSLKRRLSWSIVLAVLVVWSVAGGSIYIVYRRAMIQRFDDALLARAATISSMLRHKPPNRPPPPGRQHPYRSPPDGPVVLRSDDFEASLRGQLFEVRTWPKGELVARSPALQDAVLPEPIFTNPPTVRTVMLRKDLRVRVASERFDITDGPPDHPSPATTVCVTVARSTQRIEGEMRRLLVLLIGAGLWSAALMSAAVFMSVHVGLAPVIRLAEQLRTIGERNLSRRADADDAPSEIKPLAQCVNDLLNRLERAFDRERGFIADAAHELRTPLSAMRTATDIALHGSRDGEAYRKTLEKHRAVLGDMNELVEKLLLLARLDNAQVPIRHESIRVRDLIDATWEQVSLAVGRSGVQWRNDVPEFVTWHADPELACLVLVNLLRNALQYVNDGGRIAVTMIDDGGATRLRFANTGCTLTDDQLPAVFDRFWQADSARGRTGENAGLGLAIALRAARLMHGDIAVARGPNDWIHVDVALGQVPSGGQSASP
jgi:two-component system heavy metal sensor histidine kinase CusS